MQSNLREHRASVRSLPWLLILFSAVVACGRGAPSGVEAISGALECVPGKTIDFSDGGDTLSKVRLVDASGRELKTGDVVTTVVSPIKVYGRLEASGTCKITDCPQNHCELCGHYEDVKYADDIRVDVDLYTSTFPDGATNPRRINPLKLGQNVVDAEDPATSYGPAQQSVTSPGVYVFHVAGSVHQTDCSTASQFTPEQTFTIYVIKPDDAANVGPTPCNSRVGEPINVTTGNMYIRQTDFALPFGGGKLNLTRTYNSRSTRGTFFGVWSTIFDEYVEKFGNRLVRVFLADGVPLYFRMSGSNFQPLSLAQADSPTLELLSDGTYALKFANGEIHTFLSGGRLSRITDRNGNSATIAYDASMRPLSLTSDSGAVINVTVNSSNLISALADSLGTIATYTYNWYPTLTKVVYPDQSGFKFDYTNVNGVLYYSDVRDMLGNLVEHHNYDSQGRALTSERGAGMDKYTLTYVSDTQTKVTDGLGRVTNYYIERVQPAQEVGWRNRVVRTEGPCACGGSDMSTWTYYPDGKIATRTDALGRTQRYTYDAKGNLASQQTADGALTAYTSGVFGVLTSMTDPLGNRTTMERDVRGNLTSLTDPLSYRWSLTYDGRGLPLSATSPRNATTTFEYDAAGNVAAINDALGNRRTFSHDVRGRQISATDSLGKITSFTYDALGRVASVTAPDGSVVSYVRDLAGRTTKMTDGRGNSTLFGYDSSSRLTQVTDPLGRITRYDYDLMSRLIKETDPLGRVTSYAYDDRDNLVQVTRPPAVTGATPVTESFTYDLAGNLTDKVDGAGGRVTYAYDTANRRTSATDAAGRVTRYEYDLLGRLTAVVDPAGQRQEFGYDARSSLTTITRGPGRSLSYGYDEAGNRTLRQNFDGTRTSYTFDLLNRLAGVQDAAGGTLASYGYDSEGRLTSAQNAQGTLTFTYDAMGRVLAANDPAGPSVGYEYDANGNRTVMRIGTDRTVTYKYNALDLPTEIADRGQAISFAYDAVGNQTSRTLPNGIVSTYGYDGMDRLKSIAHGSAINLTVGRNGRDDVTSLSGPDGAQTFQYDAAGWLVGATRNGAETERYSYDAAGNRTTSHLAQAYVCSALNQLASADQVQFSYDLNGNVATRTDTQGTSQFAWDRDNHLVEVALADGTRVAYSYDALGRRRVRTVSTGTSQRYVYDALDPVLELAQDGSAREYLSALEIDSRLLKRESGLATYYLENHQGSLLALASNTGSILETLSYDSFGRGNGSARSRFDYTGRERDPVTGLLDYRARWYDPSLGRFLSEDPLGVAGGLNLYLYVGNNPLTFIDPLGLRPWLDRISDGVSGFGDYISFGLTDKIRDLVGINDVVDKCSTSYGVGTAAGIGFDLATTGGSMAMRKMAANVGKNVLKADRVLARRLLGLGKGNPLKAHHLNPLKGHQYFGGPSLFPTAGLPSWIKNGRWNLKALDDVGHAAAHEALMGWEKVAGWMGLANPGGTMARIGLTSDRGSDCQCR